MNRLLSALKTDILVQFRNNLYAIGAGISAIVAVALAFLVRPDQFIFAVPTLILLTVGGSTLLYIIGMVLFEKDERTLGAVAISPLRVSEYLWSKMISLSLLATLEGVVTIVGATGIRFFMGYGIIVPRLVPLFFGIMAIGIIYCLVGLIMVVRYEKITDVLIPVGLFVGILQLPALYFLDWVQHPLFLLIPTSAPAMLMRGAYTDLSFFMWIYGIGYTVATIVGLWLLAKRAFVKHITVKVG